MERCVALISFGDLVSDNLWDHSRAKIFVSMEFVLIVFVMRDERLWTWERRIRLNVSVLSIM